MVHAGCVFVASIHPSRTWMSGSFESVRWNACVHGLGFGLYSHPKEFWAMESEPMITPREKSPLLEKILVRGGSNPWRCIKQDSEPNTLPISYLGPCTSSPILTLAISTNWREVQKNCRWIEIIQGHNSGIRVVLTPEVDLGWLICPAVSFILSFVVSLLVA